MQSSSTRVPVGQTAGMGVGVKTRASAAADEVRLPWASLPPLQRPRGPLGSGVLVWGAMRLTVMSVCPGCLSLF